MNFSLRSKIQCSVFVLLFTSAAVAVQKPTNTGPGYDLANPVKVQGVVESIQELPGDFEGVHLVIRTDKGAVLVQVAPADFLKEIGTTFKVGDQVQVLGAKALNVAEEQILAREITVGASTVTLRDDKGLPVWAGWKPGK
jgi:hypothetical protein